MPDPLPATMRSALQSAWRSNPAMRQIIEGYATFHAILALTAVTLAILLLWAAWRCRCSVKLLQNEVSATPILEKHFYVFAAVALLATAIFLMLVAAANISNAVNPLPGFTDAIGSISTASDTAQLHAAFADWILSGAESPPALVENSIENRRIFHLHRAVAGCAALSALTACSLLLSRHLSRVCAAPRLRPSSELPIIFVGAIVSLVLALLFTIPVCANLQGALAPIANTLQFG